MAVEEHVEHEQGSGAPVADIRLESVTKRFDDVAAVDDLSLEIPRGSFFALLGPSGCGKTTSLRMIGGFEEPTAGTIYLGDRDVTGLPPYKRDVNTVFQSYALFPHLNIQDNVAFGLKRRGVKGADLKKRVADALELVALSGFERRKPRQLSGGQQQRVALARALVNRPRVLLLDEPLGALDLKLRKQMQLELKRIQSEVGITFVHVTHDQEEAMTMADTIAVMNAGRIEQLGTPTELYETPRTVVRRGLPRHLQPALRQGRGRRRHAAHATAPSCASRAASRAQRARSRSGSGPRRCGSGRRTKTTCPARCGRAPTSASPRSTSSRRAPARSPSTSRTPRPGRPRCSLATRSRSAGAPTRPS